MNWGLLWTIVFFVFVLAGLVVVLGEMIAAMLSRDSVMEGRDDLQPVGVAAAQPEPPIAILRDIPHPERYPKPWAYRAARAAEETTEIKVERTP